MVVFTKEECEYIKSFYHTEKEASADDIQHYGKVSIKFSNSSAKFVSTTNKELIEFLLNKLRPYGIKSIPLVKFMRYETGDNLARHTDFDRYGVDKIYKTFLIQLSDLNDYEGGDLIVGNSVQSKEQGWVSIINPTTPHEVTKILSGERLSLVLFLNGDNLDLKKSMI